MEFSVSFAHYLDHWHDFFVLSGTAAATLMGLLFVALSLHLDVIVQEEGAHFGELALQALLNFIFVLLISMFMLVATVTARVAGTTLMMLGLMRFLFFVRSARSFGRLSGISPVRTSLLLRFFMPAVAYVGLFLSGLALALRNLDAGMMALFSVFGLMLVTATRSAWDLIVLVGKHKIERTKSR